MNEIHCKYTHKMNEKQQDYTHKMNENGVPVYQQICNKKATILIARI